MTYGEWTEDPGGASLEGARVSGQCASTVEGMSANEPVAHGGQELFTSQATRLPIADPVFS